jgi:Tol biopolymer transport system component
LARGAFRITIALVPGLRSVIVCALAVAFLLAPAAADATLVFVRKPLRPQIWVADDNGKGARRFAAGANPRISPDGRWIAYSPLKNGRFSSELVVAPSDGSGPAKHLLGNWREPYVFAWSPDSRTIAALRGPEIGKRQLVLIDVACETGEVLCLQIGRRTVASGYFSGVSFSPDGGGQLVYARSGSERYPPRSDLYRLGAGEPVRLTHDHNSLSPVWGPDGMIVFARQLGAKKRKYGPKSELYAMHVESRGVRRLTYTKVSPLAQGLTPTAWSPGGNRLLAQFGGQDITYAVSVSPRTGNQWPLVEATEQGFVGAGFSADGRRVLGTDGSVFPGGDANVATVPYPHGKPRVLVKHGFEPSWGG